LPLTFGLLLALGALLGKMGRMAFGKPTGGLGPVEASYFPMILHLSLVLMAGLYIPGPIVAWFQHVAAMLG